MYEIIKNVIKNKDFELKDILYKINTIWVEGAITEEQKQELDNLARENANPENSYATLQEQINSAFTEIADLKSRVETLEKAGEEEGETGEEPTEPVKEEEYPEFKEPQGAHDCYNIGDKITYMGKKYICKINGCVWDPVTYPPAWEEVTEDTDNTKTEEAEETAESEDNINE